MAVNKTESSGLEQRFAINIFVAEKYTPSEFCWRLFTEKEKVQDAVKKDMLTVFWDMKAPIPIDFLEKDATVDSASYGYLLREKITLFTEWLSYLLRKQILSLYRYEFLFLKSLPFS